MEEVILLLDHQVIGPVDGTKVFFLPFLFGGFWKDLQRVALLLTPEWNGDQMKEEL